MKKINSKHTQGIYEVGIAEQTYGTTFIEVREGTVEINSSEGALIALCGNERNAEAIANAEHIVKCCNGYEALIKQNAELLEALRDILSEQDTSEKIMKRYQPLLDSISNQLIK
jgi:uncharacterized protein YifE (UPF0438 family)